MKYLLYIWLLLSPVVSFAQDRGDDGGGGTRSDDGGGGTRGDDGGGDVGGAVRIENPLGSTTIQGFFQSIIDIIMVFAIPIIVFFIVYAGFLYVTARGNVETIQQAHRALLYALIGAMLIIGANVLIDVISGTVDAVR